MRTIETNVYQFHELDQDAKDRAVENEIDYRYSDQAIIEDIECNGFEFTEDGELI